MRGWNYEPLCCRAGFLYTSPDGEVKTEIPTEKVTVRREVVRAATGKMIRLGGNSRGRKSSPIRFRRPRDLVLSCRSMRAAI